MKVEITNRKQVGSIEFFTVSVAGIVVDDCKRMEGKNGAWISGPSAAMLTKEKTLLMKEGKGQYRNPVKFSDEVQKAILAELDKAATLVEEDIPF